MKGILLGLLAATAIAAAAPASAQSIDERQANITRRVDEGVRAGALTRNEAARLQNELYAIGRLEQDYRRGGFSDWERNDIHRRLDDLSRRIEAERRDPDRGGQAQAERLRQLEQNIRDGERGGGLTPYESRFLREELYALQRRFEQARRSGDGLDQWERAELNQQIERLANRILAERRDGEKTRGGDYGSGYGYGPGYGYDNGPAYGRGRGPGY